MKVVILGDTHLGVRSGSPRFHEFFERFYDQVLFPYLKLHNIKTVWQLGDLWDQRKQIPLMSLKEARRYLFERIEGNGIDFYTLLGNHDIHYKNTLETNSSSLLLGEFKHVHIIDRPTEIKFGSLNTLWTPWICADNYDETVQTIQETTAPVCLGHFELKSFAMYRNHISTTETISRFILEKFGLVLSGHFHHRSHNDNIYYVGTPYEMSWNDFDDPKGFHVFDTETMEIEFISNPFVMYQKIIYNGSSSMDDLFFEQYRNTIVQVVVQDKSNPFKFEKFLDQLQAAGCYEIKIVDEIRPEGVVDYDASEEEIMDTMGLLNNFVDQLETDVDPDDLKEYIHQLYIESLNAEV